MKKAVLHTTALMNYKARQVLCDLFSTNQGNGSEMTFVEELLTSVSKFENLAMIG